MEKERVAADSTEFKAGWSWGGWGGREWENSVSRNGKGSFSVSISQSKDEETNHLAAGINARERKWAVWSR